MAAPICSSLAIAVSQAVNFLIAPLSVSHSNTTINKLKIVLEANLIALYQQSWVPIDPSRGSGRRCLSLSPNCVPPRPLYAACIAAGVQWPSWIAALGGVEFDLLVDPGMVSARLGRRDTPSYQLITIWAEQPLQTRSFPSPFSTPELSENIMQAPSRSKAAVRSKTLAQQILEDDHEEDDALFAMIADEVSAPIWETPTVENFSIPAIPRSDSPLSFVSAHSRSSSRSSNSSSGFSYVSGNTSLTSLSTSSSADKSGSKQSRRERARQARVYVDNTKTEVTPYDGGKTTVLTGGVMLGGAPKPKKAVTPRPVSFSHPQPLAWRAAAPRF